MPKRSHRYSRSHGSTKALLVLALVVFIIALIGVFVLTGSVSTENKEGVSDLHLVDRGDFTVSFPASGELSSSEFKEIRNPLDTSGVIKYIIDEGTTVQQGDLLIQLNQDSLEEAIEKLEDQLTDAENRVVDVEQNLAIGNSTRASALDKADINIEIAELGLLAWREGIDLQSLQQLELNLATAEINADRLTKRFEEAEELVKNGFISKDEYEMDRIRMIESDSAVKQAKIALDVYQRYTRKQDEKKWVSDVEQANAERARVIQRHKAEIVSQNNSVESAQNRVVKLEERLDELRGQLLMCKINAPTTGMVVYRSSMSGGGRRGDDDPPMIGSQLSPNELVILIPSASKMIANLKVSEARIANIRPGMRTIVYSDAHPNTPIEGTVDGISVMAEDGGWRDPQRRDYTVRVKLFQDPGMQLKPSMRCVGNITLDQVEDALSVPIQSVFREGRSAFVYVPTSGGFAQQPVTLGRSSELSVEILNGVAQGDRVLLREPLPVEVVSKLPLNFNPDEDVENSTAKTSDTAERTVQKTASSVASIPSVTAD
ncbi:MAG: hypothetical protein CBC35_10105 [Planctomycetes bacterium TMED75]|nr:hypothetical protein [Planctomycetaceae bacterium]OUU91109.1 MAG: hypothetical protein CBC35_10105 [Planctomycetes bacterium TMED75]